MEERIGNTDIRTFKPYWPSLRFPLEAGHKWEAPFDVETTTLAFRRNAKWQWKARVAAVEMVTVPAGTYQAFRITSEGTFASRQISQGNLRSWTGSHRETHWYAPEVMRIVKREFEQSAPVNNSLDHHVVELLSFTPAQ